MMPVAKTEPQIPLTEMVEHIQSHSDFVAFAHALQQNLAEKPHEWENHDLAKFLGGLAAWTEDIYGYCQNKGDALPLHPSWKMLGEILLGAKVYE